MTLEDKIAALLDEAAPLRLLPDDEAEAAGLPKIVERINALRALQSDLGNAIGDAIDAKHEAELASVIDSVTPEALKRKPGRPRKAE